MSVIRVFDKLGVPLQLGEIDALTDRLWNLNGIGQANITIAKTSPSCIEKVLRFGNRVLIQEDDMGQWGGIILPPRNWLADPVQFTAYTVEGLLEYRNPAMASYTGYAGDIFESLIATANVTEDTLIDFGDAYVGGVSWTEETTNSVYKALVSVAKRTGQDWSIEPTLNTLGNLEWTAFWHQARGQDLSANVFLEEGTHFKTAVGPLLIEQGPIYNSIKLDAYDGVGVTTTVYATDTTSIAQYGLLQHTFNETVPGGYTAQAYCDYLLSMYKEPRRTFKLSVINDDIETLKYLGLGNTISILLVNYVFTGNGLGLETKVRILSKQADERDSTLTLVVNEVP